MSLTWIKNWAPEPSNQQHVPEKSESTAVMESLLMEMDFQIKEKDRDKREAEVEEKRKISGGVDYSWLITQPPKGYQLPQLEHLELEELCSKVKPAECGQVITTFRNMIENVREPNEVPKVLRACVLQVLERRPKEETMSEWVTKRATSLTSLRLRPSTRVAPVRCDEDIEMQAPSRVMSAPQACTFSREQGARALSLPEFSAHSTNEYELPV
ncbi:unnamed protein product [Owenia fusiformis]|uniref:Uncharacterized protein n=1 Tax=Owenia fusiformis TaxID=6347 RepID=A0A8J1T9Q7_OWEFU|nr:unnamed protein product [Owenia fusiformis]